MSVYRIHRLKESVRQQFRWAPHTAGVTTIKLRDYEGTASVEAQTCYAAWIALKGTADGLQPGDVLESESGELRIFKYIGFEEAQWHVPDLKQAADAAETAV